MSLILTDFDGRLLFSTEETTAGKYLPASPGGLCTVADKTYFVRTLELAGARYRFWIPPEELSPSGEAFVRGEEENPFEFYKSDPICFSLGQLLELICRALHAQKIEDIRFCGDLHGVHLLTSPLLCATALALWMRLCHTRRLQFAAEGERLTLFAAGVPVREETEILEILLRAVCAAAGFSFSIGDGQTKNYLLDFHPSDPADYGFKTEDQEMRRAAVGRIFSYFIPKKE